jgi:hypothetical protein
VDVALANGIDHDQVRTTCEELGLHAAGRRFARAVTAPPPPPVPPMPDEPESVVLPRLEALLSPSPVREAPLAGEQVALF